MAEKVASMRLDEDDLKQFKAFAKEQGLNQQQAFNSLLALVELDRAKTKLGDRAKEIEAFRETINKLLNFYIASLDINHTTEETIREEFKKELTTQTNTIANLQEQISKLKEDNKNYKETYTSIESICRELNQQIQKLEEELIEKQKTIDLFNRANTNLQQQQQEQLKELNEYKKEYNDLEQTYKKKTDKIEYQINTLQETYKKHLTTLQEQITNLQQQERENYNTIIQLEGKLEISKEKIEIYKDNNTTLQNRINLLDSEYKAQLEQSKQDIEERYKVIYASKLLKKDEEIYKLTKKIEELEAKPKKRTLSQD